METLNALLEYWHWIVLGILLIVLEIFIPTFITLWLGLSAIIAGIALYLLPDLTLSQQLLTFSLFSIFFMVVWFKFISPRINKDHSVSGMAKEAIIGQQGLVLSFNNESNKGRIRFPAPILGNDEWNITSQDTLKIGDKIIVKDVHGNTLAVNKK